MITIIKNKEKLRIKKSKIEKVKRLVFKYLFFNIVMPVFENNPNATCYSIPLHPNKIIKKNN
jgi:hypothetical protein